MHFCMKRLFITCNAKGKKFMSTLPSQSRTTPTATWVDRSQLMKVYNIMREERIKLKENTASDDSEVQRLDGLLAELENKLKEPETKKPLKLSRITNEDLEDMNIRHRGVLRLKADYRSRAAKTKKIGELEHWSSDGLYRHLRMLLGFVPNNNAAVHTWIEAFLFRAAVLSPPDKKIVLSVKPDISTTCPHNPVAIKGHVAYAAVMASPIRAGILLNHPPLYCLKFDLKNCEYATLLISLEAPGGDRIARAVYKMYAFAKELKKTIVRGALTDGKNWTFLILKMNSDGNGAIFGTSNRLSLLCAAGRVERLISKQMSIVISGIIAYWIQHSNEDIDENDWFDVQWRV